MILFTKKKTVKNDAGTYRPISITSVVARLMERIILHKLKTKDNVLQQLNNVQFGFRSKRSTYDALFRLTNAIRKGRQGKEEVPVLFLDIKKAFDSVNHQQLLNKIARNVKMDSTIFNRITNFLQNRQFYISANGTNSKTRSLEKGVPQGCVLSPLLFNIYIDDLFPKNMAGIREGKIKYQLYADDGVVWTEGTTTIAKIGRMEEAANQLYYWAVINKMEFSKDKTNIINFSNKKNPTKIEGIYINNFKVQQVQNYKYLGITLEAKGTWKIQQQDIESRITKTFRWLRTYQRKYAPPSPGTIINILRTITIAQISYGLPFWDPSETTMNSIDSKHYKGYKQALNLGPGTAYMSIQQELKIPSVKQAKDLELIRFLNRSLNNEDNKHPSRITVEAMTSSPTITQGRLSRAPTMRQQIQEVSKRWNIADLAKIDKQELKIKVTTANSNNTSTLTKISNKIKTRNNTPIYLLRANPVAWTTTRIRFGQAWAQYYSKFTDVDGRCSYPPCKQNNIWETTTHVINDCVQTSHLRAWLQEAIQQHVEGYTFNYANVIGDQIGIPKKQIQIVEDLISQFITRLTQLRPISGPQWRR